MCCIGNKSWDVSCVIKWYGIIDKITIKMVKWKFLKKLDANALMELKFSCKFQ